MQTENYRVKKSLVIQSFAPLFLLLTIKYLDCELVRKFFCCLPKKGADVLIIAFNHPKFSSSVISILGICWLSFAFMIALGFQGIQKEGFKAAGEKIEIVESRNDGSAAFLFTYVLPLLTDEVESIRELIVFLALLIMIIALLSNTNMFYQNPVLSAMKYRCFSFKFINPDDDIKNGGRMYIGITHGKPIKEENVIKRKYISDGVFIIYND